MMDITQIRTQYPQNLHIFDRGLLREYLQYQILGMIFKHKSSNKLSFLGGTNLRIVHGVSRFSEDIDFDNKDLSYEEFESLSEHISKELNLLGLETEIKFVNKKAFHCHIKFPKLLYEQGLSPLEDEKLLIQVDTFDQGVTYEPEIYYLNKFEVYDAIRVTPKSIILSQKLWTITQRKRMKGRDFFDVIFLLQNTKPDLDFLQAKFDIDNLSDIKQIILDYTADADFEHLARDVRPFLFNPEQSAVVKNFRDIFNQQFIN